jgi:hypothetical protein
MDIDYVYHSLNKEIDDNQDDCNPCIDLFNTKPFPSTEDGFWENNKECKDDGLPIEEDLNQTYTISAATLNLIMTPRKKQCFVQGECLHCRQKGHFA